MRFTKIKAPKRSKVFDENPEWSESDFRSAKPTKDVVPAAMMARLSKRGRPRVEHPKILVTLRLDPEIVQKFRATGSKWRTRMNDALARVNVSGAKVAAAKKRVAR